jgi:hypothetical protein
MGISRVMLDLLFEQAVELGYLTPCRNGLYQLTTKGKRYAAENGLVN